MSSTKVTPVPSTVLLSGDKSTQEVDDQISTTVPLTYPHTF